MTGMTHQPAEFQRRTPGNADGAWDDDALDAFLDALPPCPGLPTTEEEIAESLARARADVAAGRVVPHEEVAKWLATWGTEDEKPMPREWLE